MLKTRVMTALALLAVLLPSLFYLPLNFWALLVACFVGVAAWEWGALLGWRSPSRIALGAVTTLLCALVVFLDGASLGVSIFFAPPAGWATFIYAIAAIFWCLVMPFWLARKWSLNGLGGLLVGAVVLFPTWLAMVHLRALGPGVLLGVMAIAWVADIAAYFSGKAFGKNKLAPTISPGKTWEGAIGAVLGVVVYGLVVRQVFSLEHLPLTLWIFSLLLVTATSIIGDLYESLLKRKAGIKDSSNVLPGHGGVLDRIDSLTSTLPVVAFGWLLVAYFRA